jgi:serine/threonine-protein kinase
MECVGRYEIIEELGRGAMGAVYKARDPMMDRDVAIKRILAHAAQGPEAPEFRERFFREARAAGRLGHAGIVTVFDVSEHEGTPFLAMEYIAGRTLQSILQSGERLDMDRVCDLGIQLAEALNYAHQNGVIHRDIKPANILVTKDNRAKIADFGIAKLSESQVTSTGQLLGTPSFMAPEQFAGLPIDGRSDLFALGVVLYWMATGDKPFTGDTSLAVQYKIVHTHPVPPRKLNPAIPKGVEAFILKSIEKDPAQRYQSGAELARDLRAWREGRQIAIETKPGSGSGDVSVRGEDAPTEWVTSKIDSSTDSSTKAPSAKPPSNARRIAFVALLLAVVGGITFALVRNNTQQPPAPPSAKTDLPEIPPAPTEPVVVPAEAPKVAKAAATRASNAARPKDKKDSAIPVTAPQRIDEPKVANAAPVTPQPEAAAVEDDDLSVRDNRNAIGSPQRQRELVQSYNSARLLITSPAVPEPLTVIVSVDNEFLFRRMATAAPPALEAGQRRLLPLSVPTAPLAEERALPPGKHKLRVTILLAARRVGRAQEITDRFFPGQRRTLNIQFSPETQRDGRDEREGNRFSISLK